MPEGWEECNGQTITDTESVYHSLTLPDLNAHANRNQYYLRGSLTSGTITERSTLHAHADIGSVFQVTTDNSYITYSRVRFSASDLTYFTIVWIMRIK